MLVLSTVSEFIGYDCALSALSSFENTRTDSDPEVETGGKLGEFPMVVADL